MVSSVMPSQEEIADQQELLHTHRRTLAQYLKQQATLTGAFAPPSVVHGIREARDQIQRIKSILRGWGIAIEDHPDDNLPANTSSMYDAPAQTTRARIFVSYKRGAEPDESIALEIYRVLSRQHEVFIDQNMLVGTPWAERIEAELYQSDFLIALLSERSVHSEMLKGEIEKASALAPTRSGHPIILPVRLAYREPFQYPLNMYLDHINWAFWRHSEDTPRLISELLAAISGGTLPVGEQWKSHVLRASAPKPLNRPSASAQPRALEAPSGTMDLESDFYIIRPAVDSIAQRAIQRQGATITIKGPRQMGKSSLLIRTQHAARTMGKRGVFLDFQLFDQEVLSRSDLFFQGFCNSITQKLNIDNRVAEYWNTPLSNKQRCTSYMESYLLEEVQGPLVLAMDEVESIFDTSFRTDFFSMLRSWHNSRAIDLIWKRLDLVLVTSTEPYQLIDDLNQSPFNVGEVIELTDFTHEQVADLNQRHNLPLKPNEERQLMALLNGHPYLARRALYLVASEMISVAALFDTAIDDRGPFGDHLRYHLFRLHTKPELVQGLRQILRHNTCPDETIFFRLQGAGLVRRGSDGRVLPRCELYDAYFREHLRG
jgi:AAA-like domain/TIR domain